MFSLENSPSPAKKVEVDPILEEEEFNLNFPNTTKNEFKRPMSYHLKVRNNGSPADKLEGRMLENSLASKVDYSYETRDCCKTNLQRDIKKIHGGNFTQESKITAINEHCRGGKSKETKEMKKMTLNINTINTGNFGEPIDLRSKTTKHGSPRRFKQIQMFDTDASQKDELQSRRSHCSP